LIRIAKELYHSIKEIEIFGSCAIKFQYRNKNCDGTKLKGGNEKDGQFKIILYFNMFAAHR
jgi:hypothetical protein